MLECVRSHFASPFEHTETGESGGRGDGGVDGG